jgi:hypothetical protein
MLTLRWVTFIAIIQPTLRVVIEQALVNMYTCCKCGHRWTNWDSVNKQDGHIPINCPKCRNIRWNQKYTKEEIELVEQIEDQHIISKDKKVTKFWRYEYRNAELDFIAYDFLINTIPRPDMFELKNVLAIPKRNIEARHELMLSLIRDRITNAEKYRKERFSKLGGWWWHRCDKLPEDYNRRYHSRTKIMSGCKHQDESEIRDAFTSLYKHTHLPKYLKPFVSSETLDFLDYWDKRIIEEENKRKETG